MNTQILKEKYKNAIWGDQVLKGLVAGANGRTTHTIERWIKDNDPRLTTATTLEVVKNFYSISEKEKLTEELK
jgi:hypothetical protein